jgi:hypothetical protein
MLHLFNRRNAAGGPDFRAAGKLGAFTLAAGLVALVFGCEQGVAKDELSAA